MFECQTRKNQKMCLLILERTAYHCTNESLRNTFWLKTCEIVKTNWLPEGQKTHINKIVGVNYCLAVRTWSLTVFFYFKTRRSTNLQKLALPNMNSEKLVSCWTKSKTTSRIYKCRLSPLKVTCLPQPEVSQVVLAVHKI